MKDALIRALFLSFCLQCAVAAATPNPLFEDTAVIKAVLTAPITQAYEQKLQDVRLYFPGQWTFINEQGENQRLEVSIRTRGNFRRRYCKMPPLQLNFKKSQVGGTLFAGQNKLKLVSPCQPGSSYQQKVVLEYLAYKTFEVLTDQSFKTRLVRISHVDSDQKIDPWTSLAFIIEDDKDLVERLGLELFRAPRVEFDQLDQARTAIVELFQLLISNYDFSVLEAMPENECCHNSLMTAFESEDDTNPEQKTIIPIPFDFDMSGLIHARYAAPPAHLSITSVRTRYYRGLCKPPGVLEAAIDLFKANREAIIDVYASSAELDDKTKKKTLEYIEEFFEILDSEKRVEREIIERCRGQSHLDEMLQ